MSYTKQQIAEQAFAELVIANYEFDISPEMLSTAVARMDALVMNWAGVGINIQYPLENTDSPTLNMNALVPMSATRALITNLACEIGPGLGKVVSPDTKAHAAESYSNMLANRLSPIPQMCVPGTMPVGAGNKPWGAISYPFFGSYYRLQSQPLPTGES